VDGTDSELCPVVGFGIMGVESSDFATRVLVVIMISVFNKNTYGPHTHRFSGSMKDMSSWRK
jgi:hypothetical protein